MAEISEIINSYLKEKHAPDSLLALIESMNIEDQFCVAKLISTLSPSANSLRGILEVVSEISRRDGGNISEILNNKQIVDELDREGLSVKEKIKRIRELLQKIRYPEASRIEETLRNIQKEIRNNFGISIKLPEDLEGDRLAIELNFRSDDELRDLAKKLLELSSSEQLKKIFYFMKGDF